MSHGKGADLEANEFDDSRLMRAESWVLPHIQVAADEGRLEPRGACNMRHTTLLAASVLVVGCASFRAPKQSPTPPAADLPQAANAVESEQDIPDSIQELPSLLDRSPEITFDVRQIASLPLLPDSPTAPPMIEDDGNLPGSAPSGPCDFVCDEMANYPPPSPSPSSVCGMGDIMLGAGLFWSPGFNRSTPSVSRDPGVSPSRSGMQFTIRREAPAKQYDGIHSIQRLPARYSEDDRPSLAVTAGQGQWHEHMSTLHSSLSGRPDQSTSNEQLLHGLFARDSSSHELFSHEASTHESAAHESTSSSRK